MTDERHENEAPLSQPIRIDDMSEAPRSTRESVRATNPTVAAETTVPGETDRDKVAEKHQAGYDRAHEVAQQKANEASEMIAFANQAPPVIEQNDQPIGPAPTIPTPQPQQLEADLSLLVTKGRIEEEVIIGGFKFNMHTLTSGENADVIASCSNVTDELSRWYRVTMATLARSISTIEGQDTGPVPLENFYQGQDKASLDVAAKRLRVVEGWQQSMVGQAMDFYTKIAERSNTFFDTDKAGPLKN